MRGIHDSLLRLTAHFPALPSQGARNPAPPATSRRSAVSGTVSRPIVNAPAGAVITPACHVAQSLRGFSTPRRKARVLKGPPPTPISNFLSYCHRPAAATMAFLLWIPCPPADLLRGWCSLRLERLLSLRLCSDRLLMRLNLTFLGDTALVPQTPAVPTLLSLSCFFPHNIQPL